MEKYTLEKMLKDLDSGFGIYFNYMDNRYLVHKVAENAYSQELTTIKEKSPHARMNIVSSKALKEIFKFMTEFEYNI